DRNAIHQTCVTQPAIVALQLALVDLWRSWGVTPAAVLGHSLGEVAAAICAGALDVEAGLTLAAHRGRLMQSTARGAMLAIAAPTGLVTAIGLPAERALASLRRGTGERANMLATVDALHLLGHDLAWSKVLAASGLPRAPAPSSRAAHHRSGLHTSGHHTSGH